MDYPYYFANPGYLGPNNRFPLTTYELLHADFAALSEEEQRKVLRDRYGRGDEIKETPEFISECLQQFKKEIDSIQNKEAYDIALFILPDYVESDRFRLAFLRADYFDAKAAACRMVTYWERKVDLFGTDKAFNPSISVLDFEESDYPALAAGGVRLLPHLDDLGRALLFSFPGYYYESSVASMVRLFWFISHAAIFDKEMSDIIQIKGIVALTGSGLFVPAQVPFNSVTESQRFVTILGKDFFEALPIKCRSHHQVSPNEIFLRLFEHLLYFVDFRWRPRMSFYNGQNVRQNLTALALCGMRPEIIPLEMGGYLEYNYQQWMNDRISEDLIISARAASSDTASEISESKHSQRVSAMARLRSLLQTQRTKELTLLQTITNSFPRPF